MGWRIVKVRTPALARASAKQDDRRDVRHAGARAGGDDGRGITGRVAAVAPRAVRARRRMPALLRWAVRIKSAPPFDAGRWCYGYLVDTIFTRDTWMHRLDISRATGRPMDLTTGHDGRLVADIVGEWARRHGQPFILTLTGPVGGHWRAGDNGEHHQLDALAGSFRGWFSGPGGGFPAEGQVSAVLVRCADEAGPVQALADLAVAARAQAAYLAELVPLV